MTPAFINCISTNSVSFLSSPELKAQVSFSDQNLSVVCRHRCRKLFTFSSSSPEPLGQFQPNLSQSILGWRVFKFIQMKGQTLFGGEINTKLRNTLTNLINLLLQNRPISTKLGTNHLWVKGIQVDSNKGPRPFPRESKYKIAKIHWPILNNLLLQNHLANFNQIWHKSSLGEWNWGLIK